MLVIFSSFGMLFFIILVHPYKEPFLNKLECFNEVTLLIVSYCFLFFLEQIDSPELKGYVGWFLIGITVFNTLMNILIVIYSSIKIVIRIFKHRNKKRESKKVKIMPRYII